MSFYSETISPDLFENIAGTPRKCTTMKKEDILAIYSHFFDSENKSGLKLISKMQGL